MKKEIRVPAIKEGTVIDHIPSRQTFRVIRIIDPQEFKEAINLALNLDSKKLGDFSCDFHGSIYALQSGFYAKDGMFEKSRGIGQLGDETIIHKDTKIDSKGRLYYEFEKTRVGTLKMNIKNKTLDKIGSFSKVKRKLKLNGDRGRHWWGKLTDVRLKERNISTPFTFPLDDPRKI